MFAGKDVTSSWQLADSERQAERELRLKYCSGSKYCYIQVMFCIVLIGVQRCMQSCFEGHELLAEYLHSGAEKYNGANFMRRYASPPATSCKPCAEDAVLSHRTIGLAGEGGTLAERDEEARG
jgi:hypothetical protein